MVTILKLTVEISGTNPSTLEKKRGGGALPYMQLATPLAEAALGPAGYAQYGGGLEEVRTLCLPIPRLAL